MNPSYFIRPISPSAHLFEIVLNVPCPDPSGQEFWLPTWIPGSYLIREFSRHIVSIKAESGGTPLKIEKVTKQRWRVEPAAGPVSLTYLVYAYDLSVRGAYLDQTRGFFNGPSVFLAVSGQEGRGCDIHIYPPEGREFLKWDVATTLARTSGPAGAWSFHARNYDELIDHPVEMGEFTRIRFDACDIPHEIIIAGRHHVDKKRLKQDVQAICETQIRFFGTPAPFERYLFLVLAVGEGYGGLEHRDSTALICSRDDLPQTHECGVKTGYRQFLGLVSHEYFHSWNVKRIKPAAYAPYLLENEAYSRLLWAFEGITSYYDDLMLLRAGIISEQEYLDQIAQAMTSVQRTPGRLVQTLEESSLDAWIKYYRQDENSPNALISYYIKGALVALALDLTIRGQSAGHKSLDDVMRALWQRFGQTFDLHSQGVGEAEWETIAQEVTGVDLGAFFNLALRSTQELPLAELLARFGVESQLRAASGPSDKGGWLKETPKPGISLGVRTAAENGQVKLSHVFSNGPAQQAGLSAQDILVAIDGLRVTPANLDVLLGSRPAGTRREFWAFRRDELMRFQVYPQTAALDTWGLRAMNSDHEKPANRNAWLQGCCTAISQ